MKHMFLLILSVFAALSSPVVMSGQFGEKEPPPLEQVPPGTYFGRVEYVEGVPAVNVRLGLVGALVSSKTTDEWGRFMMKGVPAIAYFWDLKIEWTLPDDPVAAKALGHPVEAGSVETGSVGPPPPERLSMELSWGGLTERESKELAVIRLFDPGCVSGRITGLSESELATVVITAVGRATGMHAAQPNAGGGYLLKGLVPGARRIVLLRPGQPPVERYARVTERGITMGIDFNFGSGSAPTQYGPPTVGGPPDDGEQKATEPNPPPVKINPCPPDTGPKSNELPTHEVVIPKPRAG